MTFGEIVSLFVSCYEMFALLRAVMVPGLSGPTIRSSSFRLGCSL